MTFREKRMLVALVIALRAYRRIFGNSCWNELDRRAFQLVEKTIKRVTA